MGKIFLAAKAKKREPKLAKNEEKAVVKLIHREVDRRIADNYYHNRFDVTIPLDTVTPAGSPFQISTMGIGDGIGQRQGTSVQLKRIELRAHFSTPSTALPPDYAEQIVRFLVVRVYKSDPTFQPSYNLIMGNGTGAQAALEFQKITERLNTNKKDVTILYDRIIKLKFNDDRGKVLFFNKNYKKPSPIYYDGSNRNSGQIWGVVIRSGGSTDAAKAPGVEVIWKLTYEDA